MAKVLVKAKRTFAAGNQIFYPYAKQPYEVDEERAAIWEQTGYVEILKSVSEEIEALNGEVIQKVADEPKNTENKEETTNNPDFDSMNYFELKEAAKEAKIEGYNTMKKAKLIKVLKGE